MTVRCRLPSVERQCTVMACTSDVAAGTCFKAGQPILKGEGTAADKKEACHVQRVSPGSLVSSVAAW